MGFKNALGQAISFDCSELIKELRADIAEFGGDKILEVVTEEQKGVTIYKDYNFIDDEEKSVFALKESERVQQMTASALLVLYEQENKIL